MVFTFPTAQRSNKRTAGAYFWRSRQLAELGWRSAKHEGENAHQFAKLSTALLVTFFPCFILTMFICPVYGFLDCLFPRVEVVYRCTI